MFDLAVAQARIRLQKGEAEPDQQLYEEALKWLAHQYVELANAVNQIQVSA